jgi:hypothetical protein
MKGRVEAQTLLQHTSKESVMQRSKRDADSRVAVGLGWTLALALGVVLIVSIPAHPQNRPPLQEPIAMEGTMKQFYRAANIVIVKTMDGVEHVYHFTKDLIVHGGKKPGVDALEGLREGTTVVIHRTVSGAEASVEEIDLVGDEGLRITEGLVTKIDRRNKEITIKYANGKTETLEMTGRAAADTGTGIDEFSGEGARIVVYYSDEAGRKIAHYFKKAS